MRTSNLRDSQKSFGKGGSKMRRKMMRAWMRGNADLISYYAQGNLF